MTAQLDSFEWPDSWSPEDVARLAAHLQAAATKHADAATNLFLLAGRLRDAAATVLVRGPEDPEDVDKILRRLMDKLFAVHEDLVASTRALDRTAKAVEDIIEVTTPRDAFDR